MKNYSKSISKQLTSPFNQMMKAKYQTKNYEEFKTSIKKFLAEHTIKIILEKINYSMFATHFLLHPQ